MKPTIITLVLLLSTINAQSATTADSLYQSAMALPDSLTVKQHIKSLIKKAVAHKLAQPDAVITEEAMAQAGTGLPFFRDRCEKSAIHSLL